MADPELQLSHKLRTDPGQWAGEAVDTFGLILTIVGTLGRSFRRSARRACMARHPVGDGDAGVFSTIAVGLISHIFGVTGEPTVEQGLALTRAFSRLADDLGWWTEAARAQRERAAPPY